MMRTSSSQLVTHVAVMGTGSIGLQHLEALRTLEEVCPIAIPVRRERTTQLEHGGFLTAHDLASARQQGASLCVVATDTGRHVEDSLRVLEAGLDLLVEKPLAVDASTAKILCQRADALSRQVYVGCVLRFSESLNSVRERLDEIGRIHAVSIECRSYLPDWRSGRVYQESYSARADEGGVLRDLIHDIDYAGWLFGWPEAVQARVSNLGRLGIEAEEVAELHWETRSGALVSISLDYLSRPSRRSLRAFGERGTVEWNGVTQTVTLTLDPACPRTLRSAETRAQMLQAQDQAFIQAGRGEVDGRLATGREGVQALAVCDAARRASQTKREEAVRYP